MKTIAIQATDIGYPAVMRQLGTVVRSFALFPPTLYLRGVLPSRPGVAVVGTRKASAAAKRLTSEMVAELAAVGCAIWSGGALGVDATAHRAALKAAAPTVVVTAGGLDTSYPAQHARLFKRVLDNGGALVSLQADGQSRQRHHFLERNAVLAVLTRATLMTQAPLRSGARSTCSAARKLCRPLLVVPGAPWDKKAAGGAEELSRGALAVCSAAQLRRIVSAVLADKRIVVAHVEGELPWGRRAAAAPLQSAADAGPSPDTGAFPADVAVVLKVLSRAPLHGDELSSRCGLPYARFSAALLELRLRGLVVEAAPGHYGRV